MIKQQYCAQHNDCRNTACYRKPTPQELGEMIRTDLSVFWLDYHVAEANLTCPNYRGDDYHD